MWVRFIATARGSWGRILRLPDARKIQNATPLPTPTRKHIEGACDIGNWSGLVNQEDGQAIIIAGLLKGENRNAIQAQ